MDASEPQIIATEFVSESGKTKIICNFCNISFAQRGHLNRHLTKFHQLQIAVRCSVDCVLCDEKFPTMDRLHEHIQKTHSIPLKFVEETFYCEKDFRDWKQKIEQESLSSFILRNNTRKDTLKSYYICRRSGHGVIKQNRIRKMKSSIKTGSTCPAFMKVSTQTVDGISEIKVHYQSVHIGHGLETPKLILSKEERANLAACLKLGIPMDKILKQAKQNLSPLNRYSLLTRKHLHNIRRDFRIPLNNEKHKKTSAAQNNDVEMSDNSNGYEDYVEIEENNHEETQEHEKNTAVSSLLLLQNHNYSEEVNNRKTQIVNQLKELQLRIEQWDPAFPLPDIEENIRAINALFDISTSANLALHLQRTLPVVSKEPANNHTTKEKVSKARKSFKKNK